MGVGVVARNVQTAIGLQLHRRIVEHRSGGQSPVLDRQAIQEWLEGRPRLPQGRRAIDRRRLRQVAAGSDIGQHFAAGVIQHHHRAVFHVAPGQFTEPGAQRTPRHRLQVRIERAADPLAAFGQQLARRMRCGVGPGKRFIAARQGLLHLYRQTVARVRRERLPALFRILLVQQPAGAIRDPPRVGVRPADQRRCDRRLAPVQAVRRLAEQTVRHRRHPLQFTAKSHQIEIGLENLVLLPAPLHCQRHPRLPQFLPETARRVVAPQVGIKHAGQLHGQRTGATQIGAAKVSRRRVERGLPVDPFVLEEALVLGGQQRLLERRRNLIDAHPLVAAYRVVKPQALQFAAVTIHQPRLGRAPFLPDLLIDGHLSRSSAASKQQRN